MDNSMEDRTSLKQHKYRAWAVNLALLAVLLALMLACLCVGKYSLAPGECLHILFGKLFHLQPTWEGMDEKLLMGVRFPRTCATVLVGAALALSGAVYQGIFKNPQVSPELLGVTSDACIGAATASMQVMTEA